MMVVSRDIDVLKPQTGHYLLRELKDQSLHVCTCEVKDDVRWFFIGCEVEESHSTILRDYEVLLRLDLDGLVTLGDLLAKNGMKNLDLQML